MWEIKEGFNPFDPPPDTGPYVSEYTEEAAQKALTAIDFALREHAIMAKIDEGVKGFALAAQISQQTKP